MSLSPERDVYESMVETEMEHKAGFLECRKSTEYVLVSHNDRTAEGSMERMQVEDDIDIDEDDVVRLVKREGQESPVYFEEALGTCEEVTVDYNDSSMSIPLSPPISPRTSHPRFKVKRERIQANIEEKLSMHLDCGTEKGYYAKEREDLREMIDEDEETIATFVTAAGQQLALYAVEDSEDVFAVAVYDESGEPPTNFQFLMKSDVERLIGEGAVRTVKKPSQIKRQLLTTQPPVFSSKQRRAPTTEAPLTDAKPRQKKKVQRAWSNNAIINQSCQAILDTNATAKENYSSQKQSNNVTYVMMNDSTMGLVGQSENSQESFGSESEIVEQSTVQYILLDGDQSDSELTFDEIQATLQGLNSSNNRSSKKKTFNRKTSSEPDNAIKENVHKVPVDKAEVLPGLDEIQDPIATSSHDTPPETPQIETGINSDLRKVDSSNTQDETCNSSEPRTEETENQSEKSLENVSVESIGSKIKENGIDSKQHSKPSTSVEHIEARPKIKRSRKQQLTSVNRGDSEIIIQPASMEAEEDTNNKKRGRRKKKPAPDPDYNPRPVRSKKSKKSAKNSKVEIIDIDMDEEEEDDDDLEGRKDVIEITLDDGKEKCSSDKENEIIMVGDSDDESDEEIPAKPKQPVMQCVHCSRNFRQKRALDTHSRVCPKLRGNIDKVNSRALETSSGPSSKDNLDNNRSGRREYTCKVCNEKFNAVVALARHARTEHQKKYKNKDKGKPVVEEVETVEATIKVPVEKTSDDRRVTRISQKKKGQSSNQTWKTKKLNCDDCGRWFPSTAILAAHCLQHATKNSENKIRQCHVCKKLIKTRSLYIQHMKTHGRSTRNTKPTSTVLQKKLRQTRQVASKLTPVKKRGRPRKL